MSKQKLLHVVADYGPGDLAFSEMVTALVAHLEDRDWIIQTTPVPSFDTLGTGFIVAQLALAERRPWLKARRGRAVGCRVLDRRVGAIGDRRSGGVALGARLGGETARAGRHGHTLAALRTESRAI